MSVTLGGIPLTIGDILKALKQGKQLADIGKELTIGKEKLSKALKEAGYTFSRRTGWTFAGTGEAPLNQAYTDFVESSGGVKKVNASIDTSEIKVSAINTTANEIKSKASGNEVASEQKANAFKEVATTSESESELDSIDLLLMQSETASNQRVYRGFYWDKDIINFLDNVKHGNKSDLMNEIVRNVLKAKGLI